MKFKWPNSYEDKPWILTIEENDPPIEEIRRVFKKYGLDITQKDSSADWEVTISKQKGLLEKIYIALISSSTYILASGLDAVGELEEAKK